jgi:ATP-dependent Clp protease ATP-binding subunit ClpA
MNDVVIYYGPKKGFDNYLNEMGVNSSDITTFSYLIRKYDEENREYHLVNTNEEKQKEREKDKIQCLVVYSDEYTSVREHVIINFDGFIANFDIDNLFVHNPPEIISKKILKSYENSKIKNFDYSNLLSNDFVDFHNNFGKHIIGQEIAKKNILVSLYPLLRTSFNKPIVILFYGPSGVGKTETAKFLSSKLGGELFRRQLSMFQNDDFATYLFGGKHYEKSFAKDLLERETNVILLDEFDKANTLFHSAFYQLFDEGIFVDKNYDVRIGKSIIICTSNYLSLEDVKSHLGDPIFSRFDNCIKFEQLDNDSIKKIIELRIDNEYNNLDDEEKKIINKEDVFSLFNSHIGKLQNARRIESLVRDVFSNKLLEKLLDQEPPHA